MTISTNRDSDRFIVRLPDGMRDRIKAAAEANNRSMNAEVVATLEEKYPAPKTALEVPEIVNIMNTIRASKSLQEAEALAAEINAQLLRDGHSMVFKVAEDEHGIFTSIDIF